MLKMSTREQCQESNQVRGSRQSVPGWKLDSKCSLIALFLLVLQYSLFAEVLSGGKKAEYFERLRWECPLRYEEGLSIFAGLPVRWGWRSTYIGVSLTTSSNAIPLPCLVITRDVVGAASFTCSTLAENFGKVICGTHELLLRVGSGWLNSKIYVLSTSPEVFDRMPIISAKLSVHVTGADKARKVRASSISEIGPRGL
ncbi:hypothetical protein EV2_007301 [Malus domestica]